MKTLAYEGTKFLSDDGRQMVRINGKLFEILPDGTWVAIREDLCSE
jgi:hypothetical protein